MGSAQWTDEAFSTWQHKYDAALEAFDRAMERYDEAEGELPRPRREDFGLTPEAPEPAWYPSTDADVPF